eukprot:GGOE01000322.1.p1 GENE.GGOE01000322.1~~GGOE01000322.1.p1  ORF type:complete len:259 (+),score=83.77 GGOE01000322.1:37-813(+)
MVGYHDFNWATAPLHSLTSVGVGAVGYLLLVFCLDQVKPRMELRLLQTVHNLVLSVGSLVMLLGLMVEMVRRVSHSGTSWIICESTSTTAEGPLFFWSYVYYLSKYYELVDTMLQLAKGSRPPSFFLHVYHHAVVLFMAWGWLEYRMSLQYIGMLWNTFVHVIMYYYYFLRSQGISPWWKRHVTQLQILQFLCSVVCFLLLMWRVFGEGAQCQGLNFAYFNIVFNVTLLVQFVDLLRSGPAAGKGSAGPPLQHPPTLQ